MYNDLTTGLGSWSLEETSAIPNDLFWIEIHSNPLLDGTLGDHAVMSRSNPTCPGGIKTTWESCFVNGTDDLFTCSSQAICDNSLKISHFASRIRASDGHPLLIWERLRDLYINEHSDDMGTGTWTEFSIITVTGASIIGSYNSMEVLSGGGYGVYYFHSDRPNPNAITDTWDYSHTTDTSGTAGWIHQTIHTSSVEAGRGVLGVDDDGIPYIAQTEGLDGGGNAEITIWLGDDAVGSSFSVTATLVFDSNCTLAVPDRTRAIIADGSPAFIATCQDERLYFCRSDSSSASGTWSMELVVSGNMFLTPADPMSEISIYLSGSGNPAITYLQDSPRRVVFIQSLSPGGF